MTNETEAMISRYAIPLTVLACLSMMPCLLVGEETDEDLSRLLGGDLAFKPNKAMDALADAHDAWMEGVEKLKEPYRRDLGKAIELSDEAHVLLLDFKMVEEVPDGEDDNYFSIVPYDSSSKILKSKKLVGEELAECAKAASSFVASEDLPGAFCHYPIHGLRFYREGRLIFETSICWKCGNYYLRYPYDDDAGWAGFKDVKLKAFLEKVMPIPKAEMERFEKFQKGGK